MPDKPTVTPLLIIESFDPLRLKLPANPGLISELRVRLPPVHIKLLDLSMDGIVPGNPHIGLKTTMGDLIIRFSRPFPIGTIIDSIVDNIDNWRDLWRASQEALDKCGPILD